MFARVFALLPLVALVIADSQCNTGPVNCCNTVGPYGSPAVQQKIQSLPSLGGLIDGALIPADTVVGLQCTGIAGAGAKCAQQPICCENNHFNGLINVGCSPINL